MLRWREGLLAFALVGLGLGLSGGWVAQYVWGLPVVATVIIWLGMLVPVAFALRRSVPVGLLRFRPVDLLWGLAFGLGVRMLQGAMAQSAWPSLPTVDGQLSTSWWFDGLIGPVVAAPLIEEFFFRGVVLVALFTALRRPFGGFTAGLVAWLMSTALFVLAHAVDAGTDVTAVVAVTVVGAVCGLVVLLTGRIWGAVLVHFVFNATGVLLALVGTFWG